MTNLTERRKVRALSQPDVRVASFALPAVRSQSLGLLWTALGLLISLALAVTVWAQDAGVLEGQVLNGTAGPAESVAGLPVVLRVYQGDLQEETLETTTDAEGRFRFDGLDTTEELVYWPEANYRDTTFSSAEPLRFGAEQTTLSTTITVYETTDQDSAIRLDSVHIIAESFGQVLRISEVHLFGNEGDRAYVGSGGAGQGTTIFIPLPEQAVGVAFGEGTAADRFVEVEGGFMDTEPVLPGSESSLIFFSYHLLVTGDKIPLERRYAYPVTSLNMLVAQPGLTLTSEQLQSMGSQLFEDRQFELFVSEGLAADEPLVIEFVPEETANGGEAAGMPPASDQGAAGAATRGNQRLLLWIGVGLAALAVLGAILYPQITRSAAPSPTSGPKLTSDPKARRLVAELARLQESFEAGELDEATYESQRAEKFEEIRSL